MPNLPSTSALDNEVLTPLGWVLLGVSLALAIAAWVVALHAGKRALDRKVKPNLAVASVLSILACVAGIFSGAVGEAPLAVFVFLLAYSISLPFLPKVASETPAIPEHAKQ